MVDIAAEAAAVTEQYRNQVLSQVNTSCLRLGVLAGEYPWHQHPHSDELFLVVEGRLEIELADGRTLSLGPWQSVVVPAGTVHRTRGAGRTVNLCFEALGRRPSSLIRPPEPRQENEASRKVLDLGQAPSNAIDRRAVGEQTRRHLPVSREMT